MGIYNFGTNYLQRWEEFMQEWKSLEKIIKDNLKNHAYSGNLNKILDFIRDCSVDAFKQVDEQGNTPLHYLLKIYHAQIETEFETSIADVEHFQRREQWFAVIFEALVKRGAHIEQKNKVGETALHLVVKSGSNSMMTELLLSAKSKNIDMK